MGGHETEKRALGETWGRLHCADAHTAICLSLSVHSLSLSPSLSVCVCVFDDPSLKSLHRISHVTNMDITYYRRSQHSQECKDRTGAGFVPRDLALFRLLTLGFQDTWWNISMSSLMIRRRFLRYRADKQTAKAFATAVWVCDKNRSLLKFNTTVDTTLTTGYRAVWSR